MKRRLPTASSLARAAQCLWPWTGGAEWHDGASDSFAARRGTLMHAFIERDITGSPAIEVDPNDPASVEAHELSLVHRAWWATAGAGHTVVGAEVAMQHRGDRTMLGHGREAYDKADPAAITGTADLITVSGDDEHKEIHVWDWKSGSPFFGDDVTEHRQLFALAAMAWTGNDKSARYVAHLVFVSEGGVTDRSVVVTPAAIVETLTALDALADTILSTTTPVANPGDACTFCPVRGACPETTAMTTALADDAKLATRFNDQIDSPERAAWLLARLDIAKGVVDAVSAALKKYADEHGGIETADGRRWQRADQKRDSIATDAAVGDVLREYGLSAAVEVSTSKTALAKAAKAKGDPMAAEEALAALRAKGLVQTTVAAVYAAKK